MGVAAGAAPLEPAQTSPVALKPCPFCGGGAVLDELFSRGEAKDPSAYNWFVHCTKCTVQQTCDHTRDQAIAAWNRRAGEAA
jgi:Lar family restriction alleviation protein